jgi:hypothetical protein
VADQQPEPQPGTPEFGARAEQRILNQSPDALTARSGLAPTPSELAAEAASQESALSPVERPSLPLVSGQPGAQMGDLSASLHQFDIPVPTLNALLDDPTPVNGGDPEGDIIHRLLSSIMDQKKIDQPRGFTPGEHMALGIMGALDGDVFERVVLPMLMMERNAPRQAALDAESQRQHRTVALQALAQLMESTSQHEAANALTKRGQDIGFEESRMQAQAANARNRLSLMLAEQKARAKNAAQAKVGDRIFGTYTLTVLAYQDAMRMKKLLDNNPNLGGFVEGSQTLQALNLRPKDTAEFAALGGTVNEAIMSITQRRGLNQQTMKKIGDSLADVKQGSETLRSAVQVAIRTFGQLIAQDEQFHPQLVGVRKSAWDLIDRTRGNAEQIDEFLRTPEAYLGNSGFQELMYSGHENGDTDLGLYRDDSEVP